MIETYFGKLSLQLQRLKQEGKDVGNLRAVAEEKMFEEADARIDKFLKARRESVGREYCAGRRYYL